MPDPEPSHLASVDSPESQRLDESPVPAGGPEVVGSSAHPRAAGPLTSRLHMEAPRRGGPDGSRSPASLLPKETPLGGDKPDFLCPGTDLSASTAATGGGENPNCPQPSGRPESTQQGPSSQGWVAGGGAQPSLPSSLLPLPLGSSTPHPRGGLSGPRQPLQPRGAGGSGCTGRGSTRGPSPGPEPVPLPRVLVGLPPGLTARLCPARLSRPHATPGSMAPVPTPTSSHTLPPAGRAPRHRDQLASAEPAPGVRPRAPCMNPPPSRRPRVSRGADALGGAEDRPEVTQLGNCPTKPQSQAGRTPKLTKRGPGLGAGFRGQQVSE